MSDPEEKKLAPQSESSSVQEANEVSSENVEAASKIDTTPEVPLQEASKAVPHEEQNQKEILPTEQTPALLAQQTVIANVPLTTMDVEVAFVLDRKRIPLTTLNTLAEGEVVALSGAQFKTTLFLQETPIAEGELVMIEQQPSIQITKIFNT